MPNSEIRSCTCQHESQDKLHGRGMRVFNLGFKGAKCTVCGRISGSGASKVKEKIK